MRKRKQVTTLSWPTFMWKFRNHGSRLQVDNLLSIRLEKDLYSDDAGLSLVIKMDSGIRRVNMGSKK